MISRRSVGTLIIAVCSAGCAHRAVYDYGSAPDPRLSGFMLGPSDRLRIDVWRDSELSTDCTVRPDGMITMPLVGEIPAAGLTPDELRQHIERRLRQFIKNESKRVTVSVVEVKSYRFTVAGRVEQPGSFSLDHYVTVGEAIAMAGGPTRFASAGDTLLIRGEQKIPVDYPAIASGSKPEQNIVLLPGDTVYVP